MRVSVLREAGYDEALLGMSLSYYDHAVPLEEWWNDEKRARAERRAASLAHKHGGHNKLLEHIQLWIYVQASRAFWSEADTYRAGISKQSASTMHTLSKRPTTETDYEVGTSRGVIDAFNQVLSSNPDVTRLKMNLPEGWLQERIICLNYKCLQNIIAQRDGHRLKQWNFFIDSVLEQVQHPEFLVQSHEN
jgi:hypothetical protein